MSLAATAPRARTRIKFKPPNTWGLWYWCWRVNLIVQTGRYAMLLVLRPWGWAFLIPVAINIWVYGRISKRERFRERLSEMLGTAPPPPQRADWTAMAFITLTSAYVWSPLYV